MMNIRTAMEMAKAKKECLERDSSGIYFNCNTYNCEYCYLHYKQGNIGEQREWLRILILCAEEIIEDNEKKAVVKPQ